MESEKRLSEYTPDFLFLDPPTMEQKLREESDYRKKIDKRNNSIISCIPWVLFMVSTAYTVLSDGELLPFSLVDMINLVFWAIALFIVICYIKSFYDTSIAIRSYSSRSENDANSAFACVQEASKKFAEYTAVIIIAKEDSQLKFCCRSTPDRFLYHIKIDNETEKKNLTLSDLAQKIKTTICKDFPEIDPSEILQVKLLKEEPIFTVKAWGEDRLKSVALFLYTVAFTPSAKTKIGVESKYTWQTIDELENDVSAMKTNYDVIGELQKRRNQLHDSFSFNAEGLHVIWNITQHCSYNCAICATRVEGRQELNLEGKLRLLNHLAHEKERIQLIDFAGGDPCCSSTNENLIVIQTAINIFGRSKISVTTTAEGIQTAYKARFDMPYKCEITYDASHQSLSQKSQEKVFREDKYNKKNEKISLWPSGIRELTVNVPILDDDLTDDEIACLASRITRLKERDLQIAVNLIRLMPVGGYGNLLSKDLGEFTRYKDLYSPLKVAYRIKAAVEANNIPCNFHCSLRVEDKTTSFQKRCSMLKNKIGIDCAGNVFSCAWGGYLFLGEKATVEKNPFYLGNLANQTWSEIMNTSPSSAFTRINSQSNKSQPSCQVIELIKQKNWDNNDLM